MEDENTIQFYQIWTIKNNTAFIVTISCAQENFDKHLNLMTKMLKSFTFIKQKRPMKHILLKTFVNTKGGFAIKIPVTWAETTEKGNSLLLFLLFVLCFFHLPWTGFLVRSFILIN
jgi:hypothetical protein